MEENKIKFSLTQTETIGSLQNRLFVELLREKVIFEEKHNYFIILKIIKEREILREKFTAEEIEQISKAFTYISENETDFPTKGSPEIRLEVDHRIQLKIKYTNGWNFMLRVAGAVFKIQYSELAIFNNLLKQTLEVLNAQKNDLK